MAPRDLLPPDLADRLARRAGELAPLGSLLDDPLEVPAAWREALDELASRLANTYPFPHARYAGQMLKPPHPVAWAGAAMAMLLNPNNHALDGGPETAALEREAVDQIARMFGWQTHLSHLAASGTIANLEALWVARSLHPDRCVLSSAGAHYTHERISEVVGAKHETVPQDARGRMDLDALAARLGQGGVGTVVATLGTTSLGALDDVGAIADLCEEHGVRMHVDAAYGGFHTLLADGQEPGVTPEPFAAVRRADSIVVDPHKHGLQPYGCGCVLFADPGVGRLYAHDSPYTYFTSDELHPGEVALECSRAGAAAAALWVTLRAFPLTREGLGSVLAPGREAALRLADGLRANEDWALVVEPELDIVCAYRRAGSSAAIGAATELKFNALGRRGWHVAKLRVVGEDGEWATVLRMCLMKPEHLDVVDELLAELLKR